MYHRRVEGESLTRQEPGGRNSAIGAIEGGAYDAVMSS